MYKVTKAIIVKDGRRVREYEIDTETDDLELIRANILGKYAKDCTNEVAVELHYKKLEKKQIKNKSIMEIEEINGNDVQQ